MVIGAVFSILGWKLSLGKLIDYDTVCKVFGVQFDLNMRGCGLAFVCNTDDRVEELCDALDQVIKNGKLKRSEGERLRGCLQFACGQLFGRRPGITSGSFLPTSRATNMFSMRTPYTPCPAFDLRSS